ncbi:MAG: peptidylprolyl isomerase [Gemmatimonadota bacterium]|nr:MAG: peptidylprolyl isomerase [Gemmatimonadota bacterium]
MESVQLGSVVLVDYVGTLDNGDMFDTSVREEAEKADILNPERNYTPLRVSVGQKQVIPGFEEALIGMKVGESKTVAISPEKAYGQVDEGLVQKVPIDIFKNAGMQPIAGTMVQFQSRDGRPVSALIQEIQEDSVLVDMNHPLAGETLHFRLTVNQIQ